MSTDFDYAILGAGAMGSIIGAHLARSGRRVVILARGRRAEQIEAQGLRITGLMEFTQRVPVVTDVSTFQGAEVLIVATKTYGNETSLASLRHARVGTAFSVQNGLMKDSQMVSAWGAQRVLGALADTSGEQLSSGETLFTRNERLYIGELPGGMSVRATRIANEIQESGVHAAAVPDIESLEWSKFAAWAGLMALSVTTRAVTWQYFSDPGSALLLVRFIREVNTLARARGITLSDQSPLPVATITRGSEAEGVVIVQAAGHKMRSIAPQHRLSALQDLQAGRSLEVEETLGFAVRLAAQSKVAVPLLESFYELVGAIDRITQGPKI